MGSWAEGLKGLCEVLSCIYEEKAVKKLKEKKEQKGNIHVNTKGFKC